MTVTLELILVTLIMTYWFYSLTIKDILFKACKYTYFGCHFDVNIGLFDDDKYMIFIWLCLIICNDSTYLIIFLWIIIINDYILDYFYVIIINDAIYLTIYVELLWMKLYIWIFVYNYY